MNDLIETIKNARRVVITSHIKPDGDAVGSMVAMLRALRSAGKICEAVSPSHIPAVFNFFLHRNDEMLRYDPGRDDPILEAADLYIVLDCSDLGRAGPVGAKMNELGKPIVSIDHHSTNKRFGSFNHIINDASSTGALVMNIIEDLAIPLSLEIAIPLYVAIVTDTGDFNYPTTTPKTHEKAARLMEIGVKPYEVYRKLTLDRTIEFIRLGGLALFNVQLAYNGDVAYSVVQYDLFQKFTPRVDELVMLPPYLLSIRGVEVGVLFLEYEPGRILVDLRSKGLISVASLAADLGGGGHSRAAGVRIRGEVPEIVHRVLIEIEQMLLSARRESTDEEEHRTRTWRSS